MITKDYLNEENYHKNRHTDYKPLFKVLLHYVERSYSREMFDASYNELRTMGKRTQQKLIRDYERTTGTKILTTSASSSSRRDHELLVGLQETMIGEGWSMIRDSMWMTTLMEFDWVKASETPIDGSWMTTTTQQILKEGFVGTTDPKTILMELLQDLHSSTITSGVHGFRLTKRANDYLISVHGCKKNYDSTWTT